MRKIPCAPVADARCTVCDSSLTVKTCTALTCTTTGKFNVDGIVSNGCEASVCPNTDGKSCCFFLLQYIFFSLGSYRLFNPSGISSSSGTLRNSQPCRCGTSNCASPNMYCKGNTCESCPTGQVYVGSSGNCTTCTAGQASIGVTKPCADCTSGKYQAQTVATAYDCKSCIAGQYTALTKQTACKSCVEGKFSIGVGMISIATCLKCQPGKFADPGAGQGTKCKNCIAGKYNNLEQQLEVSCKFCIEGKISVGSGNPLCTDCAAGKYGDPSIGQKIACKNCSVGKYNNLKGQLIASCKSCIVGQYAASVGSPLCTPCIAGKFTDAGAGQSSETVTCKVCDQGQYTNDTGATECKLCPMGKNLIEEGTAAEHDHFSDCSNCPKQQVSLICCPLFILMCDTQNSPV